MRLAKLAAEACLMVLFTFGLCEVALRAYPRLIPTHWLLRFPADTRYQVAKRLGLQTALDRTYLKRRYGGHPHGNWVHYPSTVVTYDFKDAGVVNRIPMDSLGFCNPPESSYDRADIDLVSIGDSFTWCMSVNPGDTWTSRLGRETGISVYNLGLPARGLEEYVELLEEYGLKKNPKYVVLMAYGGNDVRDALKNEEYRRSPRDQAAAKPAKEGNSCYAPNTRFCKTKDRLESMPVLGSSYVVKTALAGMTGFFYHRSRLRGDFDAVNFRYEVRLNDGSKLLYNPENADQDEPQFAKLVSEKGLSPSLFDGPLKRFLQLAEEHRFVPIVVYCPSVYAAYEGAVSFQDPSLTEPMKRYNRAQTDYFEARALELGFTFLDLTPHFRKVVQTPGERKLLYFPTNVHLTQAGHEEVSRLVREVLERAEAKAGVTRVKSSVGNRG